MSNGIRQSPLSWPPGWPRTQTPTRSRFSREQGHPRTIEGSVHEILTQLRRMGVKSPDVIISTDLRYRQDGFPYSNQREPDDQGAAVYFPVDNEPRVLACDRWDRIADNLWAIAKHLDAIRGQERWGVGSMGQAFRGYHALPEHATGDGAIAMGGGAATSSPPGSSSQTPWYELLEVSIWASVEEIDQAFKRLAPRFHPESGHAEANADAFAQLSQARATGLRLRRSEQRSDA